jgi:hypothetical protein
VLDERRAQPQAHTFALSIGHARQRGREGGVGGVLLGGRTHGYCSGLGFHSRASFCASAICAGVIIVAR